MGFFIITALEACNASASSTSNAASATTATTSSTATTKAVDLAKNRIYLNYDAASGPISAEEAVRATFEGSSSNLHVKTSIMETAAVLLTEIINELHDSDSTFAADHDLKVTKDGNTMTIEGNILENKTSVEALIAKIAHAKLSALITGGGVDDDSIAYFLKGVKTVITLDGNNNTADVTMEGTVSNIYPVPADESAEDKEARLAKETAFGIKVTGGDAILEKRAANVVAPSSIVDKLTLSFDFNLVERKKQTDTKVDDAALAKIKTIVADAKTWGILDDGSESAHYKNRLDVYSAVNIVTKTGDKGIEDEQFKVLTGALRTKKDGVTKTWIPYITATNEVTYKDGIDTEETITGALLKKNSTTGNLEIVNPSETSTEVYGVVQNELVFADIKVNGNGFPKQSAAGEIFDYGSAFANIVVVKASKAPTEIISAGDNDHTDPKVNPVNTLTKGYGADGEDIYQLTVEVASADSADFPLSYQFSSDTVFTDASANEVCLVPVLAHSTTKYKKGMDADDSDLTRIALGKIEGLTTFATGTQVVDGHLILHGERENAEGKRVDFFRAIAPSTTSATFEDITDFFATGDRAAIAAVPIAKANETTVDVEIEYYPATGDDKPKGSFRVIREVAKAGDSADYIKQAYVVGDLKSV